MNILKIKLSLLTFLEFSVWGSYLVSLGNFLGKAGLSKEIFWFYTVQGIVSLFMPLWMGKIADKKFSVNVVIACCSILSALFKTSALVYCLFSEKISFWPLFTLFSCGLAFYIPTIGLTNSCIFGNLRQRGINITTCFPRIRIFGTIGFIASMLLVNFISINGVQLQSSPWQLGISAFCSILVAVTVLNIPGIKPQCDNKGSISLGNYHKLLHNKDVLQVVIIAFLLGICLQITNSYLNIYITSFENLPEYMHSWGAHNANAIISISQISEALCVLVIPFFLSRFGIKITLFTAAVAWGLRFILLGIGNVGDGIIFLILSMIVYGIAFDFVNISGAIYLDNKVETKYRNRIQSLFMFVMSGLGATLGTPLAGVVINNLVFNLTDIEQRMTGWQHAWMIFGIYAFIIAIFILVMFKPSKNKEPDKLIHAQE